MRPVFEFGARLKGKALAYCRPSDSLLMFGGCHWDGANFRDPVRFRYTADFYRCRRPNAVEHIEWEKMKGAGWSLPHKMVGFGHVLLDDAKLLVFGGRVPGGHYLDAVWMMEMDVEMEATPKWFRSTLRIPRRGKYRAVLIDSARRIDLFQYGHPTESNGAHFSIAVDPLMATMQSVAERKSPPPPPPPVPQPEHYSDQEAAIRIIRRNGALSNSQKRKRIRKLKRKWWKCTHSAVRTPVPNSTLIITGSESLLSERVRSLQNEMAQMIAERDGLVARCRALAESVERAREENRKLRALLQNGRQSQYPLEIPRR